MELSELSRIVNQDGAPRETNRTIKPADRCVISYNFQQTHSHNYTHNLLIGMFGTTNKKINKNGSQLSIEPPKSKLVSLAPQAKRVYRQDPSSIVKVYNNQIDPKKYVNQFSGRRKKTENGTQHQPTEKSEYEDSKIKNQRDTFFEKTNEDVTIEEGSSFREPFNEIIDRKKSPYHSKNKKKADIRIKQNSIGGGNNENQSPEVLPSRSLEEKDRILHGRVKENSNYSSKSNHSRQAQGQREGKNSTHHSTSSNKFGKGPSKEPKRNLHFYGKNSQNLQSSPQSLAYVSKYNSQIPSPNGNHLKKVTQNQLEINEGESKYQQKTQNNQQNSELLQETMELHPQILTVKYNEEGEIEGKNSKDSSFEVRKSRKQIQDEQMRQIEQKIRREESKQFKKGYFKILNNNSKEFLPFNADLEPVMHISKKKGRTDGSTTKTTLYKQSKKMVEKEQLRLGNTNKRPQNSISGHLLPGNNAGSTKPSFYKEKGVNKHSSIDNFRSDQKIIPNHKTRSPEPNESFNTNLNQHPGSKFNQQNRELAHQQQRNGVNGQIKLKLDSRDIKNNQIGTKANGNSFSIKRQDKSRNKQKINGGYHNEVVKEDITANNQIRGYKIPEKNSTKQVHSLYKEKGETSLNYSNNLGPSVNRSIQKTNAIQKQSIAGSKQVISQNKGSDASKVIQREHGLNQTHKRNKSNPSQNQKNGEKDEIYEKDKSHHRSRHVSVSSSRQSHEKPANMNTEDYRASKSHSGSNRDSEDYPRLKKNTSKERSISKSKFADSTIPRQPREKDRKFKDWKTSDIEKQRKNSRKVNPLLKANKNNSMSSLEKSKEGKNSKRSKMLNEIDLDAEEEDPFGLSAQKNVTSVQRNSIKKGKKDKKMRPSVFKQERKEKKEGEQQIEQNSKEDRGKSHSSHVSSSNSDKSSFHSHSSQKYEKLNDAQIVPLSHLNENGQIDLETVSETKNPLETPIFADNIDTQVPQNNEEPKKEGVEQIQQLIQENGSQISSIDDEDSMVAQKAETKYENSISEKEKQEETNVNPIQIIVTPDCVNQEANLEELLKATEEVYPNQKQLEPILNNVEVQLGQSPLSQENQEVKVKEIKRQSETDELNQEEPDLAVNLPQIKLQNINHEELVTPNNNKSPRVAAENESDYHDEQMDKIVDILPENTKEHNRSSDFFQCNLNQTSKMSDPNQTINYTRYQVIDKDTTNYSRAPILSFLYQVSKDDSFSPSTTLQSVLKRIKNVLQINEEIIDQAVNILLSIDPWIIERIFQPFEDTEGKIGVWLYCYGVWKLFLENKKNNFRIILRQVVNKAIRLIDEKYQLEAVIKLISGVRVIRLKSGKKRIFNELQYSLRKGHVIKAYTSSESKWKGKVFEVAKVETTRQNENVLQIRQENDTYWVREEKFQQIFEHFLLICTRNSHFWTNRSLQHKQAHKTVLTMTSHVPSHGSLTLFYPSNQKSSLLLYKELDSKVLKYMGKIEEKANQNGNLYFQFRLHGTYSLFLETPTSCLLAIESTTPLEIGMPEYVLRETLRNEECEYVELSQNRQKGRDKEPLRGNGTLQKLRDTFIRMVVKK